VESTTKPRILVVDDDPVFCRILKAVAEKHGIPLTYFSSVREAYRRAEEAAWDVAIVDYDLGSVTGVQLGRYLEGLGKIPVVLVSAMNVPQSAAWPETIASFLSKKEGPEVILLKTLSVYREHLSKAAAKRAG
jgi:CheY-like chemotaxis protein